MSSKACIPISSSKEKMKSESDIIIECTLDGCIKDYRKQGTPLRSLSIIGKSVYDLVDDNCKYDLSMKHIQALAHREGVFRLDSVIINSFLCSEISSFSCIIFADEENLTILLSNSEI